MYENEGEKKRERKREEWLKKESLEDLTETLQMKI
jgi:hypothetical protein